MVGADLIATRAASHPIPVVLAGGEPVSGLADMLQQFIEQTVAESPRKARQARRLAGEAVFRSAEDEALCVRITFGGDRIALQDCPPPARNEAVISADFLTIAHLTSGRESALRLLVRRRLQARFAVVQLPFLLRVLRFMQIDTPARRAARLRRLWATAAFIAAAGLYWYGTRAP